MKNKNKFKKYNKFYIVSILKIKIIKVNLIIFFIIYFWKYSEIVCRGPKYKKNLQYSDLKNILKNLIIKFSHYGIKKFSQKEKKNFSMEKKNFLNGKKNILIFINS